MSPKMSSLAYDEILDQGVIDYPSESKIISLRNRNKEFSTQVAAEEVVQVTGKFTVSF